MAAEITDVNLQSDYGLITSEEYLSQMSQLTGMMPAEIEQFILSEHHKNEEMLNYILSLRPRFKTAVLSNVGIGWFDRFITPEEQEKYFDVIVNSGKEGMVKPDPRIFTLTAERLGVEPSECVMIDDIDRNCAGAEQVGMTSINYSDNAGTIAQLEEIIFS